MKRFSKAVILAMGMLFAAVPQNIFAQSETEISESEQNQDDSGDYEGDGDYYEEEDQKLTQNGPGDQFIKLKVMPVFPLGFDEQLFIGGGLSLGYHRFLSQFFAVGAEIMFAYNPTIGNNMFTIIPFTLGVTFQPYIGRFEFPISVNIGGAVETYLQYTYFPGLIVKGDAGCYFRINENWSAGLECNVLWLPQWISKDPAKNDNYLGITAAACARYHF
ncbi:MAG: hypothetical protein KBT21_05830 [Treponema sp.]|nr:hypothetical protein [Candidatus Treponema merdequi]